MRKLIVTAAAAATVLGWTGMAVANPDTHPTQAPKDGEHKKDEHAGDHKDDHHAEGEHKEEHKAH
ncbi:hypothetical protein [Novosphingobium sp. MMS21-SN21R]|uniref:hypothetical protein n=1 Tax=Novosphingobium sp. MMS21-SN21R TaxID=2969298 RepID=UPI0028888AB9|nr:hypothetical protein [Novosphingobium sp. MMS21-SN21R]MDT0507905.1 hypothetical protein [Novosphingobium sp. MMS21-SN21R]